ncbi:phospholipase D-like domain-containing protein [Streptomyces sp. NPDC091212]|uniref:phospholipase D-like domain-containing protein n=1 Tax=Streptomyces sp. NPDC091212 TaxID=3155191 RepID=UPI00342FA573
MGAVRLAPVLAALLGASLLAAPTVAQAADTVPLTSTFNHPAGTGAEQNAIRNQLVSLIQRSPSGSRIDGSIYLFTDTTVSAALVAAKERGVKVKMIIDGDSVDTGGSQYDTLKAGLGTTLSADSWVLACPVPRGCLGNRKLNADHTGAINHNKFFLFSQVGDTDGVVFQTSANLTTTQRTKYFNNAVTIPDAGSGLYTTYRAYWEDLKKHGSSGSGLDHYYKTQQSGKYKTYFFPRKEDSGTYDKDPSTDTIVSLLKNVSCAGGVTRIRVGMYAFTRVQVADKLVSLKQAGCRVDLLHNDESGNLGTAVGNAVKGNLTTVSRCKGTTQNADGTTRAIGVHSKYLLIEGTYLDATGRKLVFTGSHNYTFPNLRSYDETLLKIDNAAVYDTFKANFESMRTGSYCTQY